MNDLDVALQLEARLLNERTAFPCGCVLECHVHYPFKDWAYTGRAVHACTAHSPEQRSDPGSLGPLEKKWLKADGVQLTLAELEAAMEEALDRLDEEEERRVKAHNAVRHHHEDIDGSYGSKELLPGRASRVDPHIASQEGRHAIGRFGSVAVIHLETWVRSLIRDEPELQMNLYKPGAFVELKKLQKERAVLKHFSFAHAYSQKRVSVNPIDLTLLHKDFHQNWPSLKDVMKGATPGRVMIPPLHAVSSDYAEWDVKLMHEPIEISLDMSLETGLEEGMRDSHNDTLPSTLSKEEPEEEREEREESGCQVIDTPRVMPGWGCCRCRSYNGDQRTVCKHCGHTRCGEAARKEKK